MTRRAGVGPILPAEPPLDSVTRLVRRAGAAVCALVITAATAGAQTAPAPFALAGGDYTFTEWAATAAPGTYPASMRLHRGPVPDPGLADEPNADYTGAYGLTSGTRINGLGADGLAFANTTGGDLGAAVVAVNTAGLANVRVAWTGGTVAVGTRPYAIRLQYRVGASGPFTDAPGPVEYTANATAGHFQTFVSALPPAVDNQPVVHVRWKYYQTATGTGGRARLRLDDITISTSEAAASGTGTAAFAQTAYRGGQTHTLELVVTARSDSPGDRLTDVAFTLPAGFPAPAASSVTLQPAGGAVTVEGLTVRVAGASATLSAPLRIAVAGVAVPDVSLIADVGVRTGAGSPQTVAIAVQPALRVWSTPEPIAAVRANNAQGVSTRLGQTVTVRAVVTASDEFETSTGAAGPSYFEDATAGMAVFSTAGVSAVVETGEEVILLGRVDQFFGLNQLNNTTTVVDRLGQTGAPAPLVVTLAQLAGDGVGGVEQYEGRLVRVDGVTVNTATWTATGSGTNYRLTDASGMLDVRVNPGVDFANQPAPGGVFSVVGVMSQFRPAAPFVGGYQLMPRSSADILDTTDAPTIAATAPFETAATASTVTLRWTTDQPAHTEVRYVGADGGVGLFIDETRTTEHVVTLSGLQAATVYRLALRSAAGADTAVVAGYPVSTGSAPGTTGVIEVSFNKTVDASVAVGQVAQTREFSGLLISRINAATHSLDVALYSLSGTVGMNIADALVAARDRGVRVRVIMDDETSTTAPPNRLRTAGIPLITDDFGANDGAFGLHHNKFVVIDRLGPDPARVWTMTGSWNPTDPGTNEHFQNVVYLQDGAVAGAYTAEFEQMWGSTTATPDAARSRFHRNKTLVAPTAFWVGGVYTRLVFSPQGFGGYGSVEGQINAALATADFEVALGLNLITRQTIVSVLEARAQAGVEVRAAIGDVGTTGSVFVALDAFADAFAFPSGTLGLLHHKYATVDAQHPASDPTTITGSHNWSRSANEDNNENTLILHSASVANQYLQEFAARYRQAGGTGTFPTGIESVDGAAPVRFEVTTAAPNPTRGATRFTVRLPEASAVTVRVVDVLGREVARPVDGPQAAGTHEVTFDASGLAAGVYVVRIEATAGGRAVSETRRITVVR